MALTKKPACRNSAYQKVSFDLKLSIIDQAECRPIANGQISVNHVAKVYNISRSPSGGVPLPIGCKSGMPPN